MGNYHQIKSKIYSGREITQKIMYL